MSQNRIPRGAPGRRPGTPQPPPTLKPGAVVFFGGCKKSTRPDAAPFMFKGHGFGVFLGVVPFGVKEPTQELLDPMLSQIGWVSFENVFELLGEEQFRILEAKFHEKYQMETVQPGDPVEPPPPVPREQPAIALPLEKQLIGLDGRPLHKEEKEEKGLDV